MSDRLVHLKCMETATDRSSALEPLMSMEELAEYLGVPIATIYDWRVAGRGPCGVRVGRHVKFAQSDVVAWIAAHRESRPGQAPAER